MFHRHRVGISVGLVIIVLVGGAFGYIFGGAVPGGVLGLTGTSAAVIMGVASAAVSGLVWLIGEAIVGIAGAVGRDATLLRLGLSLFGSFASIVTAGLRLVNIELFQQSAHSIFAYLPIASGLGSIALGAHAIIHQLRLDRGMGQ